MKFGQQDCNHRGLGFTTRPQSTGELSPAVGRIIRQSHSKVWIFCRLLAPPTPLTGADCMSERQPMKLSEPHGTSMGHTCES